MSDQRITQLNALPKAGVSATDVLPIADISASETKKVTSKDLVAAGLDLIDAGSIDLDKLDQSSTTKLGTVAFADGAITAAKLAVNSSTVADTIAPTADNFGGRGYFNTTTSNLEFYDGTAFQQVVLPTAGIGDLQITTGKLANGAVTTDKVTALGTAAIADDAVTTAKIIDGAISAAKIATDTITATQIATDAVGAAELADDAVDTAALVDDAVTTAKIADGVVTTAKLGSLVVTDANIANTTISYGKLNLADASIPGAKLVGDSVTATEIAASAVGTSELAASAVTTTEIADDAVTTAKLATDSVTADAIVADAVGASELADDAVDTAAIVDAAVTTAKIADGVVTTAKLGSLVVTDANIANTTISYGKLNLADASIPGAKLVGASVTATEIAENAVGTSELAASAVTTTEIADDAVTTAKLATDSVTADAIAADAVGASELANDAVDTTAIVDAAVITAKIADGAVTTAKLGSLQVTNDKIANATIADTKLNLADASIPGAKLVGDSVTATEIAENAVGTSELAASAVTATEIADDAVTAAKLATDSVTADAIAADAVGASELADDAVDTAALVDAAVTTAKIADGVVTTAKLGSLVVTDANIANTTISYGKLNLADASIPGAKLVGDSVTATEIAASAVGTSELAASAVTTTEIADDAVTAAKLAGDSVTSAKILAGAVLNEKIADAAVTYTKIQDLAADSLLGRGGSSGVPQEITCTDAGRALLDDATVADQRTTLGLGAVATVSQVSTSLIEDDAVTAAKLANESTVASVTSLPASGAFIGQLALVTSTNKVYSWSGAAWTSIKAAGSINSVVGSTSGLVDVVVSTTNDEATITTTLDNTSGAAQFLAGPTSAAGAVSYRALDGADLPTSTATAKGGVIVNGNGLVMSGDTLTIDNTVVEEDVDNHIVQYDANGLVTGGRVIEAGDIPAATATSQGAARPGSGLSVDSAGAFNHINSITAGSAVKVDFDAEGHITATHLLEVADIPDLDAAKITTGTFGSGFLAANSVTAAQLADYGIAKISSTQPTPEFAGQLWVNPTDRTAYVWVGQVDPPEGYYLPLNNEFGAQANLRFGGTYNASTNTVATLNNYGAEAGLTVGSALAAPTVASSGVYLLVTTAGTGTAPAPAIALDVGDWLLSPGSGTSWTHVNLVGAGISVVDAGDVTYDGTGLTPSFSGVADAGAAIDTLWGRTQIATLAVKGIVLESTEVTVDNTTGAMALGVVDEGAY